MGDFDYEAKMFNKLARMASVLAADVGNLEIEAMNLAAEEARAGLLINLEQAVATSPEFQRDALRDRLVNFFSSPELITVSKDNGIEIRVDSESAKSEWIEAQQAANQLRNAGKKLRGWAAKPSPAQRAAYWRNKVYPDLETWGETIELRMEALGDPDAAPFWYFLEYGTGIGAHPTTAPKRFIQKTRDQFGGFKSVNKYLNNLMLEYEKRAARAFDSAVMSSAPAEVIIQQEVRWSTWYSFGGKQKRHEYNAGTGGFTGRYEVE